MYPAPIDEYVRPVTVADARAALGLYDEGDAVFVAAIQELWESLRSSRGDRRGQAIPGTNPSPVRESRLPAFAVRERDAWRPMALYSLWKRSELCPGEPCACPDS